MNNNDNNIEDFNINDFNEEIKSKKSSTTAEVETPDDNLTSPSKEKIDFKNEKVENFSKKEKDVEINITDSLRNFTELNKNNLFNKIFLGVIVTIAIFIIRFLYNTITAGFLAYRLNNANDISALNKLPKILKKLSAVGSSAIILKYLSILTIIFLLYFVFEKFINHKKLKRFLTSANITAIASLIMLKISNFVFADYLVITKTVNSLYHKSLDLNSSPSIISSLFISGPSPILTFFAVLLYIVTLLLFLLTAYILYLRIFTKKSLNIKIK